VCNSAFDLLDERGVSARLVSMPCMERFLEQDEDYRNEVLPPDVGARVVVEAASTFGWHEIAGDRGAIVGMTTFGASAPQPALYEHFGFTPDNVASVAEEVAKKGSV
jgi:transketolase